jgi:hypothetical protein
LYSIFIENLILSRKDKKNDWWGGGKINRKKKRLTKRLLLFSKNLIRYHRWKCFGLIKSFLNVSAITSDALPAFSALNSVFPANWLASSPLIEVKNSLIMMLNFKSSEGTQIFKN